MGKGNNYDTPHRRGPWTEGRLANTLFFGLGAFVGVVGVIAIMAALGYGPLPSLIGLVDVGGDVGISPGGESINGAHNDSAADWVIDAVDDVDLLSEFYPAAVAGDAGWDYHQTLAMDLNDDGRSETVHVIAKVSRVDAGADEYIWDDGHAWSVYIEDADGHITHVFRGWVQLGRLRVRSLDPYSVDGGRGLLLMVEEGAAVTLYRLLYHRPGDIETSKLIRVGTWEEAS